MWNKASRPRLGDLTSASVRKVKRKLDLSRHTQDLLYALLTGPRKKHYRQEIIGCFSLS